MQEQQGKGLKQGGGGEWLQTRNRRREKEGVEFHRVTATERFADACCTAVHSQMVTRPKYTSDTYTSHTRHSLHSAAYLQTLAD